MRKRKSVEYDLHVWAKAETKDMVALFTVSIGKRAICIDMPIDAALESIRTEMESNVG